jgi:hypothetical protein
MRPKLKRNKSQIFHLVESPKSTAIGTGAAEEVGEQEAAPQLCEKWVTVSSRSEETPVEKSGFLTCYL